MDKTDPRRKTVYLVLLIFIAPTLALSENFDLGLEAYQRGDYVGAYGHWHTSSLQGHIVAKANLGGLYMQGQGVLQNQSKALDLFRETSQMGIPFAQFNLALMYEKGRGMLQDRVRTHMWYNIAASNGHEPAINGRENVTRYMTASSIAEAERRAANCFESTYQDC